MCSPKFISNHKIVQKFETYLLNLYILLQFEKWYTYHSEFFSRLNITHKSLETSACQLINWVGKLRYDDILDPMILPYLDVRKIMRSPLP